MATPSRRRDVNGRRARRHRASAVPERPRMPARGTSLGLRRRGAAQRSRPRAGLERLLPPPPRRRRERAARFRRRREARAAGVSAVTSGVPQASAWYALFGITRVAFDEAPKMPSAHAADRQFRRGGRTRPSAPTRHWAAALAPRRRAGLRRSRKRTSGSAAAAPRIVSTCAAGSACRRTGLDAWQRGARWMKDAFLGADGYDLHLACAERREELCVQVSATTTSAAANARRSTARRPRAGSVPARKRAIADKRVRQRHERVEDQGTPGSARRSASRSRWPGYRPALRRSHRAVGEPGGVRAREAQRRQRARAPGVLPSFPHRLVARRRRRRFRSSASA